MRANAKFMNFISRHGRLDPDNCQEMLSRVKGVFDDNDIIFLLVYGTLLGAYRDTDFIPYDEDVDLLLFQEDKKRVEDLRVTFEALGFEFLRDLGDLISYKYGDDYVDFYFVHKKGKMYVCNSAFHYHQAWQLETLSDIVFRGKNYKTVCDVDQWLTTHYGDWRTPVKNKNAKF